jgi:predicted exporter
MRPPDAESVVLRDEIAQSFGSGFDSMMLVIRGETIDQVLTRVHAAAEGAREMVADGVLTGFDALTTILPPPDRQRQSLAWLEEERDDRLDTVRIRETFEAALAAEGLRVDAFGHGLDLAQQALAPDQPIDVDELVASPTTGPLLERYLKPTGDGGWQSVVYLYPPPRIWRRQPPPEARELADRLGPETVLTGANVVSSFLRKRVLRDAVIVGLIGLVLVALLLWLDYHRWLDTLLSMLPLFFGISWMLGAMAALGMAMNFMNIFVSTMIIGIGVDYGVHMVHRYREVGEGDRPTFERGLSETGKAIVMAALSTIMGFGSLSLSHYPGLRSIGLVAILGAISTSLVAITLLPAYLSLRYRRRQEAEALPRGA